MCLLIPENMTCCDSCDQIFCVDCLTQLEKNNGGRIQCPVCQEAFVAAKINKTMVRLLNRSKFSCQQLGCNKSYTFEDRHKHQKVCIAKQGQL